MPVIKHDGKEYDIPLDNIMDALSDDEIEQEIDHRNLMPDPEIEYMDADPITLDDPARALTTLQDVAYFLRQHDKPSWATELDDLVRELDL